MKRRRSEEEEEEEWWEDLLIDDVRDNILSRLDKLSLRFLAETSRRNGERCLKIKRTIFEYRKAWLLVKYGTPRLLVHYFPDEAVTEEEKKITLIVSAAARNGNIDNVRYLLDTGFKTGPKLLEDVATSGHLDVLRLLIVEYGLPFNDTALFRALEFGHNDMAKWLIERYETEIQHGPVYAIVSCGNFPMLQWIRNTPYWTGFSDRAAEISIYNGPVAMLQWLIDEGAPLSHFALWHAINRGKKEHYRLLINSNCPACSSCAVVAVNRGDLEALELLTNANCSYNASDLMMIAASFGHTHILQWFLNRGRALEPEFFGMAMRGGHVETMEWIAARCAHLKCSNVDWDAGATYADMEKWQKTRYNDVHARCTKYRLWEL